MGSEMLFVLLGLALVLLLLAVVLWKGAGQRSDKMASEQFIHAQLDRHLGNLEDIDDEALRKPKVWQGGPRNWSEFLLRAGVVPTTGFYLRFWLVILVPSLLAGVFGGVIAMGACLLLLFVLSYFRLWVKGANRRKKIVAMLPEFLDRVVRMMTIGNSMSSAFHHAAESTEQPLRDIMDRAVSLNRSGKDIDVSLHHVARQFGLHELYLVAAVVGVSLKFGGRSDQVLERMSAFMRDLEQARAEMKAMSAELRLSAWVLALLPLGLACFILVFNNALFMGMWNDPAGQYLLVGAGVLQIVGSYWLYRLAKSI